MGSNQNSNRLIVYALIGMGLVALYFVLIFNSPLIQFLNLYQSREEIDQKAEALFQNLPIEQTQTRKKVIIGINKHLLDYIQYFLKENGQFLDISPGYWEISWQPQQVSGMDDEEAIFSARFSFEGSLLEFSTLEEALVFERTINLTEDDAMFVAMELLERLNIKTDSLIVAKKDISEKAQTITYQFILKNSYREYPDIIDQYTVKIVGNQITSFQIERNVDPEVASYIGNRSIENIIKILTGLVWLLIACLLLFYFIRRLRRDQLDFRRATQLGILMALFTFLAFAFSYWPRWLAVLILGNLVGLVVGMAVFIIYSLAEAECRENWPEKLRLSDLLFQGKIAISDMGRSILQSFLIIGATLFLFGIIIWTSGKFNLAYLSFNEDFLAILQNPASWVSITLRNVILSISLVAILLAFLPNLLKRTIENRFVQILILTVVLNLTGIPLALFKPSIFSFLLVLPVSLLWAVLALRFNFVTLFLSLLGSIFFLNMMLIILLPGGFFSLPGLAIIIINITFLALGLFFLFRSQSVQDFDTYVPDYISRIAEQERLQKELEIARSVQMRFLPQSNPQYSNMEIVSLCQPAMEVGGDYYDFLQLDQENMSILMGDVSGKGVSAAFYMTMIKGIVKTLAKITRNPAQLLVEANDVFSSNVPREVFITIIYGLFDLKNRRLDLASAGHNPLIYWHQESGEIQIVNPKGIALGLDRGNYFAATIKTETIPFSKGDIFFFFTDGVSEAMNIKDEIFGIERLCEIIKTNARLPAQQIQHIIIEEVSQFTGKAPQHDDFTMVLVKIHD